MPPITRPHSLFRLGVVAPQPDLASDPAHQAVVLEMAQKMLSWRLLHQEHVLTNLHNGPKGVEDRRVRHAD